jgi:geranylgeranyl pyrophosphate synthase
VVSEFASLDAYLTELRLAVEDGLGRALSVGAPPVVLEPMRYALLGGGKRLRPCLTLAAAEAVASRRGQPVAAARLCALPAACAIELVHCYSLVHDDLPAMDDDVLRRGRPTTHVVFGDGLAILAGDGLLTEAFALLAEPASPVLPPGAPALPPDARVRALRVLASAAGASGMVGGQAIDLAAAGRGRRPAGRAPGEPDGPLPLDEQALTDMHARKTGALIRAAATMGAIAAGADEATLDAIDRYAREVGLAFQIVDDLLDVQGSHEELGKTPGKDEAAGKPTYPAFFGIEASRRLAGDCVARAKAALANASLGGRLAEIAEWSLTRRR